jgi:membrane protein
LKLLKDSAVAWNTDGAASMGAAIAYYTIFSIAPLLIITMAIAGFFFGAEAAQGQIYAQARSLLGEEGATALQGLVQSASKPAEGVFATIVSLLFMVLGASGVFAELQGAMDRIWQAPVSEKQSGLWYLLRRRIFTFGMLLAVAFLLLVSLAVSAFISTIQSLWGSQNSGSEIVWQGINFIVSFIIVSGLFALIFKLLPRVKVAWRDVAVGAVMTALLFNIGKFLIGLYIGKTGAVSGFGAAGSVIAMVLWVYYSAQIFLFGAEFTWLFAKNFGSMKGSQSEPKAVDRSQDEKLAFDPPKASRRSKLSLEQLLKKLFNDGKRWLKAEFALAKSEAAKRMRNYAIGTGLIVVGFLIVIPAVVILASAGVVALTPYLGGGYSGLVVGVILLAPVVLLGLVAKHLFSRS